MISGASGACGQQGCVEAVVAQAVDECAGLVFPQLDGEAGIGLAQRLEDHRHQVRRERGNDAQLERADQRVARGAGYGFHLAGFSQGAASVGQNLAADGVRSTRLLVRSSRVTPSSSSSLRDLAAECGLAHVAGLGGAAKMAVLGDGNEIAEVLEIHREPENLAWLYHRAGQS